VIHFLYDFDDVEAERVLKILQFEKPDETWLEFVVQNRRRMPTDASAYDIIKGPVANDDVYEVITLYENGLLELDIAIKRLKVKELFSQTLLKTEKALKLLSFQRSYTVKE
jgi:hypothetical protein